MRIRTFTFRTCYDPTALISLQVFCLAHEPGTQRKNENDFSTTHSSSLGGGDHWMFASHPYILNVVSSNSMGHLKLLRILGDSY